MLQRIQSVFLLVSAIVMVAILFLPMWNMYNPETMEAVKLTAFQMAYVSVDAGGVETLISSKDTYWIAVLAVLGATVALISIFSFKNRLRQMQLNTLNSLIMGGCLLTSYFYSTKGIQVVQGAGGGNFQIGFYIIAIALLCNSLGNRFIRKDEKLVRSADRIR